MHQPSRPRSIKDALPLFILMLCVAIASVIVYVASRGESESGASELTGDKQKNPELEWVSDLVLAENLILKLTIELDGLNQSAKDLTLPNQTIRSMFADQIVVVDIEAEMAQVETFETLKTKVFRYDIGDQKEAAGSEVKIWSPLLSSLQSLQDTRFYFIAGQFSDESHNEFVSQMGFEGLGQLKTGQWAAIHAKQNVTWTADPTIAEDDLSRWTISRWDQVDMDLQSRDELMFRDVFATAIESSEQKQLLVSAQDEFVSRIVNGDPINLPYPDLEPFFQSDSTTLHPAVSIVDVNQDGWDDFYLMTRWEKNRLFVNQKDGTFKNLAPEYGLDIDRTSCALFADFDNDGDKDVFLGRSYSDSLLMINEDGKFVDRTSTNVKHTMPGFVTSISAADYNNDGLLDVYLSTYVGIGATVQTVDAAANFMPRKEAEQLLYWFKKASPADIWLKRPGPPNRLLVNNGNGTFDKSDALHDVWANTFQATWCDYDDDGDVDLYLSNDFAPDCLYRNNGKRGFKDVAQQTGGNAMRGYGMGSSWGDYDNDGRQDLYVSNMYSKAGKRIIRTVPNDMDPRYLLATNGNRLFKNQQGERFDLVSGEEKDEIPVTKAGWSWGGQFSDFDNDGFLDIYVASGFYTAPKSVSCNIDL